jgi:hypothetical protein
MIDVPGLSLEGRILSCGIHKTFEAIYIRASLGTNRIGVLRYDIICVYLTGLGSILCLDK